MSFKFRDAAKEVVTGNINRASDEVRKNRLSICGSCPFFTSTKRCQKCGCFMPAKTMFARAKCPIGKW